MAMLLIDKRSFEASERARKQLTPSEADMAREQRDNALVTGNPAHPVSLAKRDIEMVSHHVTLNWRQSAVRYLNAAVTG